jgi:hypothetical protein
MCLDGLEMRRITAIRNFVGKELPGGYQLPCSFAVGQQCALRLAWVAFGQPVQLIIYAAKKDVRVFNPR